MSFVDRGPLASPETVVFHALFWAGVAFYIASHWAIVRNVWPVHGYAARGPALLVIDSLALLSWIGLLFALKRGGYRGRGLLLLMPFLLFMVGRPSVFHAFSDPAYLPSGGETREEARARKANTARMSAATRVFAGTDRGTMLGLDAPDDERGNELIADWSLSPGTAALVVAPVFVFLGLLIGRSRDACRFLRQSRWWWTGAALLGIVALGFAGHRIDALRGLTPWEVLLPVFLLGWASTLGEYTFNFGAVSRLNPKAFGEMVFFGALPSATLVFIPWTRDLGLSVGLILASAFMLVVSTRAKWWAVTMGIVWMSLVTATLMLDNRASTRFDLAYDTYRDLGEMTGTDARSWAARVYQVRLFDLNVIEGGLLGEGAGLGYGETAPNAADDGFVTLFAAQWGLVGSVALMLLYSVFIVEALVEAAQMRGAFERSLIVGLAMLLAVPLWLAFLGGVRAVPLTGVPVGFLAHGTSKLVASCLSVGLIIGLSHRRAELTREAL